MTTQEKIAVMQAYIDGQQIQFRRAESEEEWADLSYTRDPNWNWKNNEYRVEPEPPKPTYVPYESAEEFLKAQKEHGPYLYWSNSKSSLFLPTEIDNNGITINMVSSFEYSYSELANKVYWQDGTTCGKLRRNKI